MPGVSSAIIGPWQAFCASADENTTVDDAAAELATEIVNYHAGLLAGPPSTGANIVSGLQKAPIENAIKADLKALQAKESEQMPLGPDFAGTAAAIVSGITAMSINAAIPALPCTLPVTGYTILVGGNVGTLQQGIATAMGQLDPSLTASLLVSALASNALSINGLYAGLQPTGTPPFTPLVVPWSTMI
jgi:hypothetical protein